MKKILIIEDNEVKARALSDFISTIFKIDNLAPIARSYRSGVKYIQENTYDLIILDMTMNTFDVGKNETGGKPKPFAGKHVLDQIDRFDLETPVIVVTGFEKFGSGFEQLNLLQLDEQLHHLYNKNYKGIVYYHASQSDWRKTLLEKIFKIFPDLNHA